jgi:hypothetical protein
LILVPPSHTASGIFIRERPAQADLLASNSLVALLVATGLELRPDISYPDQFIGVLDGISASPISLPVSEGTLDYHFHWNLRVGPAGGPRAEPFSKVEEAPFASYADYTSRLSAAMASAFANAPQYEPVVSLSSGYDSTAVAALAAAHGCRRAVTFSHGRRTSKSGADTADSGAATARRLGMEVAEFDRLSYQRRSDLPEAEFLATGSSGEDVIMSAFEARLPRSMLLTGTQGNGLWRIHGRRRTDLSRTALDGTSLNEYRLRVDFLFVPVPTFGMSQRPSVLAIAESDEMRPWSVGGRYDQPISRRIAEEAGIPRGTFGVRKHAASALLHVDGEQALAPATAAAVRAFATAEGRELRYTRRFRMRPWHGLLLRYGPTLRMKGTSNRLRQRRRALSHFDGAVGSTLLRWAVNVIRPRYTSLTPAETPD